VLLLQDPELLDELQLAAEPPAPARRSKYAGNPEGAHLFGSAFPSSVTAGTPLLR
jgi:hypothetical protein